MHGVRRRTSVCWPVVDGADQSVLAEADGVPGCAQDVVAGASVGDSGAVGGHRTVQRVGVDNQTDADRLGRSHRCRRDGNTGSRDHDGRDTRGLRQVHFSRGCTSTASVLSI